ncbi:hypothetical protein AB0O31_28620 [Kitasatospora cineracea]|uniref:hypothetical protein n=1 Tax=Kitasatospora cineracea TaxID=88074 RepID=UPI00343089DD
MLTGKPLAKLAPHNADETVEPLVANITGNGRPLRSFGFGRKVVPALPIGYDTNGEIVWEQRFPPLLDRAQSIGSGWLHDGSPGDCAELVTRALRAFTDSSLKAPRAFRCRWPPNQ